MFPNGINVTTQCLLSDAPIYYPGPLEDVFYAGGFINGPPPATCLIPQTCPVPMLPYLDENGGWQTFFDWGVWVAQTVSVPRIDSIDPPLAMIGSNGVQITISGAGFGSDPTVNLPPGFSSSGQGSQPAKIVITVNITLGASVGQNNMSVTVGNVTSKPAAFTVNGPNKMVVQTHGDVIAPTSNNPNALSRYVTYQVQNVDGTAVGSILIAEGITLTGWNCQQTNPGSDYAHCDGTYKTNSNGVFTDEWGMYTGYTPAGCGENITDHWQWCGPAGSNPPAPNPGITFGTLSGWIHTAAVKINGYTNPPTPMPDGFSIGP